MKARGLFLTVRSDEQLRREATVAAMLRGVTLSEFVRSAVGASAHDVLRSFATETDERHESLAGVA